MSSHTNGTRLGSARPPSPLSSSERETVEIRPGLRVARTAVLDGRPSATEPPSPEEWMRGEFPNVFAEYSGTVFERARNGRIRGISAPHLFALCLTDEGSPEAPLIYCPDTPGVDRGDGFLRYEPESGIYEPLTEAGARRIIDDFLARCAEGSDAPEEVHSLRKPRWLSAIAQGLKGRGETDPIRFLPRRRTRHVANGILDIETLELRDFTPEAYSLSKLPAPWDPDADSSPRFEGWMEQMFPDSDDRNLALSVMALALLGNPLQKLVLLRGPGGDGKTTFVKLIAALVGQRAAGQLRLNHLNRPFEAQRWFGKLLLQADEVSGTIEEKTAEALKRISGQSLYEAELKNANNPLPFEPRALPVLISNAKVRIKLNEDQSAWERRLVVLDASADSGSERSDKFEQELIEEEGPGILRLVARQAHDLLQKLDSTDRFRLQTERQRKRAHEVLQGFDAVSLFVAERVEYSQGAKVHKGEVYEAAREWLRERGYGVPHKNPLSKRISVLVKRMGATIDHNMDEHPDYSTRGWTHVRLVS